MENKVKEKKLGIALLRMFLCYEVVLCHFGAEVYSVHPLLASLLPDAVGKQIGGGGSSLI